MVLLDMTFKMMYNIGKKLIASKENEFYYEKLH